MKKALIIEVILFPIVAYLFSEFQLTITDAFFAYMILRTKHYFHLYNEQKRKLDA